MAQGQLTCLAILLIFDVSLICKLPLGFCALEKIMSVSVTLWGNLMKRMNLWYACCLASSLLYHYFNHH
jgi:hypothetical protein